MQAKMFSANDQIISLIDSEGRQVDFINFEEMKFYTGVDLTEKDGIQISYEPDRGIHSEMSLFNGEVVDLEIPNEQYEAMIRSIDAYQMRKEDPIYGLSPEDAITVARQFKHEEIERVRIDKGNEAESNPDSFTSYGNVYAGFERRINRQNNISNKKAGEIPLDQDEKEQAKIDQKLTEHHGKLYEAEDKGKKDVDKLNTAEEVMSFDPRTDIDWPEWRPPRGLRRNG